MTCKRETGDGAAKDPEMRERGNKKKVECEMCTDGKANKLTDAMSTDEKNANTEPGQRGRCERQGLGH